LPLQRVITSSRLDVSSSIEGVCSKWTIFPLVSSSIEGVCSKWTIIFPLDCASGIGAVDGIGRLLDPN